MFATDIYLLVKTAKHEVQHMCDIYFMNSLPNFFFDCGNQSVQDTLTNRVVQISETFKLVNVYSFFNVAYILLSN